MPSDLRTSSSSSSSTPSKYAIITGMSADGISFYTVKELINKHNYYITVVSRSKDKTEGAIRELTEQHGVDSKRISFYQLDISDLKAVKQFANEYSNSKKPLHTLILNSGVYRVQQPTAEGFSGTFATNYLGHFYLVQLLTPLLKQSKPSRVIWVSSLMHRFGHPDFRISAYKSRVSDYADSKLYMILAAREFHRQQAQKDGISHYVLHPGSVNTKFYAFSGNLGERIIRTIGSGFFLTPEQGAQPIISAAIEQPTGTKEAIYLQPYKPLFSWWNGMTTEMLGTRWNQQVTVTQPSKYALDDELSKELYQWTEKVLSEVTK